MTRCPLYTRILKAVAPEFIRTQPTGFPPSEASYAPVLESLNRRTVAEAITLGADACVGALAGSDVLAVAFAWGALMAAGSSESKTEVDELRLRFHFKKQKLNKRVQLLMNIKYVLDSLWLFRS